jgi:hypothetical protein
MKKRKMTKMLHPRRPFRKGPSGYWQFELMRNRRERRWVARLDIEREASGMGLVAEPGETNARLTDRILDAQFPERKRAREEAQAKYGKGSELYWAMHRATNGFLPGPAHVEVCIHGPSPSEEPFCEPDERYSPSPILIAENVVVRPQ